MQTLEPGYEKIMILRKYILLFGEEAFLKKAIKPPSGSHYPGRYHEL